MDREASRFIRGEAHRPLQEESANVRKDSFIISTFLERNIRSSKCILKLNDTLQLHLCHY